MVVPHRVEPRLPGLYSGTLLIIAEGNDYNSEAIAVRQMLTEKILGIKSHGEARAGDVVIANVDLTFIQDTSGPLTPGESGKAAL